MSEPNEEATPPASYLVGLLKHMALADGSIDPREERIIRRVGAANGMSQAALDKLFQETDEINNIEDLRSLPYNTKFDILYNLLILMKADDIVVNEEITMAQKIANAIGFQLAALMELYPHAHPNVRDPQMLRNIKKKLEKLLLPNK